MGYLDKINDAAQKADYKARPTGDGAPPVTTFVQGIITAYSTKGTYSVQLLDNDGKPNGFVDSVRPSNSDATYYVGQRTWLFYNGKDAVPVIFSLVIILDSFSFFQSTFETFGGLLTE